MPYLLEFGDEIMDTEPKNYEIAYLIHPDVQEDAVFGEAGKITGFVQDAKGVVGRIGEPKKLKLAYPINKIRNAYFGWTSMTIAPEYLPAIEKQLKAEKQLIRFLIAEEVKRPLPSMRQSHPFRRAPMPQTVQPAAPFTPQAPKEEDKMKIEELDKRLEEILGK